MKEGLGISGGLEGLGGLEWRKELDVEGVEVGMGGGMARRAGRELGMST